MLHVIKTVTFLIGRNYLSLSLQPFN